MSTGALTHFHDDEGEILCTLYRQSDGYPSCHGQDMLDILKDKKIVNGIWGDSKDYNGCGDLVIRVLVALKNRNSVNDHPGCFYMTTPGDAGGADFVYHVRCDDNDMPLVSIETENDGEVPLTQWTADPARYGGE